MAWATSSDQQKESMLRYLALQNDDRDIGLIIFVAEDESSYFKLPPDISKVSAADLKLRPLSQSNSGTLELLVDDTPVWRLNINFTNGLGLSPLAIRVFRL